MGLVPTGIGSATIRAVAVEVDERDAVAVQVGDDRNIVGRVDGDIARIVAEARIRGIWPFPP